MLFSRTDSELKSKFFMLNTRQDLAELLEVKDKDLIYYLYRQDREMMYTEFLIPKRNGGTRLISAPSMHIKYLQKKIAYILNLVYKVKPSAFGFISNRNILENAKRHTKKTYICNIDLKDFFPSINFGRVLGLLTKKPYSIGKEAAIVISQIACYKGVLPQGSPCSPIISNMICSSLDTKLMKLAKKYRLMYTRYADDITFSSTSNIFPNCLILESPLGKLSLGKELQQIIVDCGFNINDEKIHLNSKKSRQEVTGLTVNVYPNIRRCYINITRSMLDKCRKLGVYRAAKLYISKATYIKPQVLQLFEKQDTQEKACEWYLGVLSGRIDFIGNIKGKKNFAYLKFADQFNRIIGWEYFNVSWLLGQNYQIFNSIVVIKRDDYSQGTGFYLKNYGLVTSYHVTGGNNSHICKVFDYKSFDESEILPNLCSINLLKCDEIKDYAIYTHTNHFEDMFELGDSSNLKIGDPITVVGFPNFCKGDSPNIQEGKIIGIKKNYLGTSLLLTDARIVHGASGGPVLDKNNKAIGIIRCGVESIEEDEQSITHGFVPISVIL